MHITFITNIDIRAQDIDSLESYTWSESYLDSYLSIVTLNARQSHQL